MKKTSRMNCRMVESAAASAAIELLEKRAMFTAVTVNIDPSQTFQTLEGMGAAMVPFADIKAYHDPNFYNMIVNDLGATMARAEILPNGETQNDDNDPNHINFAGFDENVF